MAVRRINDHGPVADTNGELALDYYEGVDHLLGHRRGNGHPKITRAFAITATKAIAAEMELQRGDAVNQRVGAGYLEQGVSTATPRQGLRALQAGRDFVPAGRAKATLRGKGKALTICRSYGDKTSRARAG